MLGDSVSNNRGVNGEGGTQQRRGGRFSLSQYPSFHPCCSQPVSTQVSTLSTAMTTKRNNFPSNLMLFKAVLGAYL